MTVRLAGAGRRSYPARALSRDAGSDQREEPDDAAGDGSVSHDVLQNLPCPVFVCRDAYPFTTQEGS